MDFVVEKFDFKNDEYYAIILLYNSSIVSPINNKTMKFTLRSCVEIVWYILKYIPINLEEYNNILRNCGAIIIDGEYVFKNEKDIQQAIEILEEKYLIAIKLMEK